MKMFLSIVLIVLSVKENEGVPADIYGLENSTSCEEFLNGTSFDSTLIIDVYWRIFYFWHIEYEKTYQIKFSTPSDELIRRFKVELDDSMRPPVVWSDAEFFMESSIDISALYIRTNTSGLYRVIPAYAFKLEAVPMFLFGMKIIEPGYLGLMNCKHRLCYALAPVDKMPPDDELEDIAVRMNFRGEFNFTYMMANKTPDTPLPPEHDEGDQDDEIQQDLDKFDFI